MSAAKKKTHAQLIDEHRIDLGAVPDDEIARRTGVPVVEVGRYRRKLGVPAYDPTRIAVGTGPEHEEDEVEVLGVAEAQIDMVARRFERDPALKAGVVNTLAAVDNLVRDRGWSAEEVAEVASQRDGAAEITPAMVAWYRQHELGPAELAELAGGSASEVRQEAPVSPDSTELIPYSDGRPWDERLVAEEVCLWGARAMHAIYEMGRRLIWAKKVLGRGAFGAWRQEYLPFSERTCQRYMTAARFLVAHPAARDLAAKAGLKKTLKLVSHINELGLDQDAVDEALAEGEIAGVELKRLEDMSYNQLRLEVARQEKRLLAEQKRGQELERELEAARDTIADGAMLTRRAEEEIAEQLDGIRDDFDKAIRRLHPKMMQLARGFDQMSPALQARFRATVRGMGLHVAHEGLCIEEELGEHIAPMVPAQLTEQLDEIDWPVDEGRKLKVVPLDPELRERARRKRDGDGPAVDYDPESVQDLRAELPPELQG